MKKPSILIINGPNLNLVGCREPEIYGYESFKSYLERALSLTQLTIEYYQSNHEGAIIDMIQQADSKESTVAGIVLNAGAYAHTSLAIADAVRAIGLPVVEVHISNIFSRDKIRHRSLLAPACIGLISGFGLLGYKLAIEGLQEIIGKKKSTLSTN